MTELPENLQWKCSMKNSLNITLIQDGAIRKSAQALGREGVLTDTGLTFPLYRVCKPDFWSSLPEVSSPPGALWLKTNPLIWSLSNNLLVLGSSLHLYMHVSSELHSIPVSQKETESQRGQVTITQPVSADAGCKTKFFELCLDYLFSDCSWQHSL